MKTSIFFIALLSAFGLRAQSQILGIFEQGAEELQEYGQQVAALEVLLNRQQKGYQVIESGLSSICSITGDEFNLHQNYYTNLATVNSAITQTPESAAILSTESQILDELSAALTRWRQSPYLSPTDLAFATRMNSVIINMATLQISIFDTLISNNNLTMTDDQRVEMINQINQQAVSLFNYSQSFITSVDLLILDRKN
jgi:hypothetical protein